MINLEEHGIKDDLTQLIISDLVVLSNIEKKNIDTKLISRVNNVYTIKGEQPNKVGSYAIVGCEIIKIVSQTTNGDKDTVITADRSQLGTVEEGQTVGMKFRTVVPLIDDIELISWDFHDTMGTINTSIFPVELSSGSIVIKDDPKKWLQFSLDKVYRVKNKKSMAFLFKGVNDKCFLKNATVIERIGFNTRGKSDPNKITIKIKSMLFKWYDKDVAINQQIKAVEPKEFFKLLLGLDDTDVYYADGVTKDSFVKIGNIHTKEYKKMSSILKAYGSCGVRFCFDRYERVKIFSDSKIDDIHSQKTVKYNIVDTMINENSLLIFNTIDTTSTQRQPMFDFDELDRRYVYFASKIDNIIQSDKLISIAENGDLQVNSVEITNSDLFKKVQLKDYVLFKGTKPPYLEVYGKVGALLKGDKVVIFPILQGDKDYRLFFYGKGQYLYDNLNKNIQPMNIYFSRFDLPMIWRYTRNQDSAEKYSNLMTPILPRVDGKTEYEKEVTMKFGSASNLEAGQYSGIIEEVNPIYGTWDNTKLLYNKEFTQFNGKGDYPPIFALSNRVEEKIVENQPLLMYTHFDNSGLLIEVTKNEKVKNDSDGKLKISSTLNVNSSIDIYEGKEVSRIGNRVLEVESLDPFKVGDILIVKNFDNPTFQDTKLYDEKLKDLRWRITNKVLEVVQPTVFNIPKPVSGKRILKVKPKPKPKVQEKYFIFLDSNFPPPVNGKKYTFKRFPVESIVYLQELYFRGNPVIQYTQEVSGSSNGTNEDGDLSQDIYGEKKYGFDSKLLEKDGVKMLMGYILDHFNGTTPKKTKYQLPISVFNGIDIELYDVITVIDEVFTHVGEGMLWLVTGVKYIAKNNIVELSLFNLNATNTKPYDIDIDDVIDYKPVEIPNYDHAGGEGEVDKPNDGSSGSDKDKALGEVALSEIDRKVFRARIDRVENQYVYFKDFAGTEWETYAGKLFPESEFAINVDGEIVFVHSDKKYRAYIKKRKMFNTEEAVITPEMEVTFYVVSTKVDIDGTFYSRRVHIGDGDTYFTFHPITGAKFVGDFVVGENNQHAGNDLWESMQKNRTFEATTPPTSTALYTLREGDIWYDTNDENHCYRYNGDVWRSRRDGSIISTRSSTFVQPTEPVATEGRPLNDGDTWYDSDDGYKPYVYKGEVWINVTDKTLVASINEAKAQAKEANDRLADIASDSKLTPSEKQATKKDVDIIKGEFPKIKDEGVKFGVSVNTYDARYNELLTFIEPMLEHMGKTEQIEGDVFRSKFKQYYDSRQDVLNGISTKAKQIGENAQTSAENADKNADKAHEEANKINDKLADIASDSKLTASEKQSTKKDVEVIKVEYPKIINEANKFSVTTTQYTTSYNELLAYINPLLSNLNTTSDINGDVFRTKFKTYYDRRQDVMNGISSKAKELADQAQKDATTALGNAKIFHMPTAPTSGMKTNDLWYDTDDGNHPYVYNGTTWISARDKIFETEGGNKVYFQTTQPPTSGKGVKEGDMWFDTAHNNKMFILIKNSSHILTWTLADDALDKVNTGRIVLNGNTTINGDFKVVGKNIELNGETKINGIVEVFSSDKGIISYNGASEASSTKRIIIKGGEIIFQERV